MFAIINVNNTDRNIGLLGRVESLHRTEDAADKKVAADQRACRRANGGGSWLPVEVVNLGDVRKSKGDNVYRDEIIPGF